MMLPVVSYVKLGLGVAGAILVASAYFYVQHLKSEVAEQVELVQKLTSERTALINQVQVANASLEELKRSGELAASHQAEAITKAEQARVTAEKQLTNLRRQRPPVQCDKAIEWSIQRKEDLAW